MDAQDLTRVPSTEKCSSDSSGLTQGCAKIAVMTLRDMSVVGSRSRFLLNVSATLIPSCRF